MGAEVEFPIGKKLFHLVVNPGTSQCPTVDLEVEQTTRNVNRTRHSVRKFQLGKRAHLFRFSTFSGNFPVGRADETCSIYRRTGNSGNFDLNAKRPRSPMGQENLVVLTGDRITKVFKQENVWPFCQEAKKSAYNNEVTYYRGYRRHLALP